MSLETDVVRPLDEARQVALGLDVLANTEGLGSLLDQRVLSGLLSSLGLSGGLWGLSGGLGLKRNKQMSVITKDRADVNSEKSS